ncbi:zonular occludens toxin domain-containing protein [Psychrobacter aquimaris]|uniref:zonular occludens toxin domain-containing protein n=1 Tax=Psychrobacter aquimaris TaxID=292733 RepID=UPI003FCFF8A3
MPIILVNGSNGHGKGQFAIKMILDYQKENDALEKKGQPRRPIFANIHGINEKGKKPLKDVSPIPSDKVFFGKQNDPENPPPEGYYLPPIGSIFFYDECQEIDWAKKATGALSSDIRVTSLEKHRHSGLDVIFLTQSTNYIHSHIFGLVSPHYYVERPLGLKTTNVFMFNKAQKSPESTSTRSKADDQTMIALGKKYGQYYESSAQHNMKYTIPTKLKVMIVVFIAVMGYAYFNFQKTRFAQEEPILETGAIGEGVTANPVPDAAEQAQQVNEELKTRLAMLEQQLYDQRLPPDYQVTAKNPSLRVAGVVNMGDKGCRVYNAFGEVLNLTGDDCDYYLAGSGRVQKPHGGSSSSMGSVQSSNPSSSSNQPMVTPAINPVS